ncbi:MAG TPA: ABC transporter ATP-binding protein, partial [bacterium]|nr:ABC transporter ATP-binding protein [bacterium]
PKTMLFVTHSIDEALILGSHVALMTRRPGRIKEVIDVNLPRPRDPDAVRRSPRYLEMREHIWHQLKIEVGGRVLS